MNTPTSSRLIAMVAGLLAGTVSASIDIETVTVGNPGNYDDTHGDGYGRVVYTYDIGKYEVTAGQYTAFLNAVAATDTYGLYSTSMDYVAQPDFQGCNIRRSSHLGTYYYSVPDEWANRPVNYVSWCDAARFCNWLHNGQPTGAQGLGTTEDGSYFLNGATSQSALAAVKREADATWAIPTEDEWYKAAFHKNNGMPADYWTYPTSTDSVPSNDLVDPDPGNNANFYQAGFTIGSPYRRTEVGDFENSEGPYGTFDQGGNVAEWNETVVFWKGYNRGIRGGSYETTNEYPLSAEYRGHTDPTLETKSFGFRVCEVPEPGTIVMLMLASAGLLGRRRP